MEARTHYKPYWRINKSLLPIGITWEEAVPSLCGFLFLKIFLDDFIVPIIGAILYLIISANLKRSHRGKAAQDIFFRKIKGDHFYVSKNRSFKFN